VDGLFPVGILVVVVVLVVIAWRSVASRIHSYTVYPYHAALLYRHGRYQQMLEPGRHRYFGRGHEVVYLDRRRRVEVLPAQETLTRDRLGVKISLVFDYVVADARQVHEGVESWTGALYSLLQIALRGAVETVSLDELLTDRETVATRVMEKACPRAEALGLTLHDVAVRDIMVAKELRAAYAATELARKEGEAALERARGETAALRSLANGARLLKDNPALIQLRTVQALTGDHSGKTTVFLSLGGLTDRSAIEVTTDTSDHPTS